MVSSRSYGQNYKITVGIKEIKSESTEKFNSNKITRIVEDNVKFSVSGVYKSVTAGAEYARNELNSREILSSFKRSLSESIEMTHTEEETRKCPAGDRMSYMYQWVYAIPSQRNAQIKSASIVCTYGGEAPKCLPDECYDKHC